VGAKAAPERIGGGASRQIRRRQQAAAAKRHRHRRRRQQRVQAFPQPGSQCFCNSAVPMQRKLPVNHIRLPVSPLIRSSSQVLRHRKGGDLYRLAPQLTLLKKTMCMAPYKPNGPLSFEVGQRAGRGWVRSGVQACMNGFASSLTRQ